MGKGGIREVTILTEIIDSLTRFSPPYDLLFFEGESYSNLEVYGRICRLGNALRSTGMQRGDMLMAHMENCPDAANLYSACAKTGIVFCPTMFLLSAEELSWIAEHSEARYLVTTPNLLSKVRLACPDLSEKNRIILAGAQGEPGTISLEELCREQPDVLTTDPELSDEDVAALLYTAGTTGRPKGVILSHGNIGSNVRSVVESMRITRDEVALSALPLSHSYGLTTSLLPAASGITSILMRWFDATRIFEYTERFHIRSIPGVPAMFIQLLNHPRAPQYNVKSWKRLQSGAAPLPEEVMKAFREKFGVYLYEGYGLTEASPVVSAQSPHLAVKPGSVGPPIEGVEIKIRDDFERELPPGSPGEITVHGPSVMKGYFKDPEETERALRGGWLHTGDIGYIDEDGHLFIVERKKDLIITGGFNLYPSEVEGVLQRHPSVAEAAVVGEPDPIRGEVVHSFVVLEPGMQVTEKELIEFARNSLVYYKCPGRVTFLEELPRTFLGKPSRRELRDRLVER
ncbi:MAG: long-chain fatty acid--CoA ligase [Actinobacteria bacterium]|jgi:long-chain acyl-CoA synthetase|nr:MAG: long-chain fatty acid--CoA ligase [Actinomycetota bacterium]